MKMDRLIGILSILLQREQVTAPELAEQFEVSRRTIQRDIEALGRAGIPIATAQGAGGGISIMEGYRVDRTVLTAPEMQAILAGLRSLDSVSGTRRYAQLMEKLSAGNSALVSSGAHMLIDLSSWYKSSLAPKIEAIQTAIQQHQLVQFTYDAPKGTSTRRVEPYYLVFRWSAWYLWGWCLARQDFRLFKLNRMTGLSTGRRSPRVPHRCRTSLWSGFFPPNTRCAPALNRPAAGGWWKNTARTALPYSRTGGCCFAGGSRTRTAC